MYFDKEEFIDEMYLYSSKNGNRIINFTFSKIVQGITVFVMLFACWKIGNKPSKKCIPYAEAVKIRKKHGIFIN